MQSILFYEDRGFSQEKDWQFPVCLFFSPKLWKWLPRQPATTKFTLKPTNKSDLLFSDGCFLNIMAIFLKYIRIHVIPFVELPWNKGSMFIISNILKTSSGQSLNFHFPLYILNLSYDFVHVLYLVQWKCKRTKIFKGLGFCLAVIYMSFKEESGSVSSLLQKVSVPLGKIFYVSCSSPRHW